MNEILKQCVGIDISKDTFTVCVCRRDLSGKEYLSETVDFKNLKTGFNQLVIYTALNGIENILEQNPWWNYIPHFVFCIALLPTINIKNFGFSK